MNEPNSGVLEIRLNFLEEDCQQQPQLTFTWGQELAKVRKEVKELKRQIKLGAAEISMAVRADPEAFGLEKVTESGVEATVLLQINYQDLQKALIDKEFDEESIKVMIDALADRREELGNLVKLFGQMYWAKPDTAPPGMAALQREEVSRAANSSVGKKSKTK